MPASSWTLAVSGLLLLPLAGCVDGRAAGFEVQPVVQDSALVLVVQRAPEGLRHGDLLVVVDGQRWGFAPAADLAGRLYEVGGPDGAGKDGPGSPVEPGDALRLPLSGRHEVLVRRLPDGTTIQRLSADVPDATGPPAPELLAPAAGTQGAPRRLAFAWSAVEDPAGVSYDLEWWAVQPTGLPRSNAYALAGTSHPPGELPAATEHRWRVRAVDGVGNVGLWSPAQEFVTGL